MREKFIKLSKWSFVYSIVIFFITYIIYHYVTDSDFTLVFQQEDKKPFVTLMFGILGTLFLFSSIFSILVANIFYKNHE